MWVRRGVIQGSSRSSEFVSELTLLAVLCIFRPARPDDSGESASDIARLRKDILPSNYQAMKMVRPVVFENSSMTLTVSVKISDLVSFELDKNEAVTQLSMCLNWVAETLTWDPADYNGLRGMTVSAYEIWLPDIEIYNHIDFSQKNFDRYSRRAYVSANGTVEWCPEIKSTVSCDTDMSHFPHDSHGCVLLIGSATYNFEQLRLKPELIRDHDLSGKLVRSSNWEMRDVKFELVKGDQNDYYDYALHLTLHVSRRFSLHLYSFTLPLFVCAILTLIFCWLPLAAERRFHLAILSVVLNMYLMVRYSDTLRHSTRTPWGLRFASDLMLFTCLMIVVQILCLALEDAMVPFAAHPIVDRFLATTFVSTYVLNDRLVLINEEEFQSDGEENTVAGGGEPNDPFSMTEPGRSDGSAQTQPEAIMEETTKMTSANQKWREFLIAIMRISVTVFLFGYAFTYYILNRLFVF
ncbi:neuronal acetylcholine receptor subunit alpha-10-like [Tropilaelaps mercedesae]|uniref:Neuronal acetylcholine receptor subunit alpha-10-like n=1 Tax=Tropilaelaps mercedesae TaxID=418985 RepID=A0A1V9XHI5_9ACAR|nr:neuronal acetylcholine receptor subunit alpha-10-like [Tropilaelaps mercedesae]